MSIDSNSHCQKSPPCELNQFCQTKLNLKENTAKGIMFDFISPDPNKRLRPIILPLWLKLQEIQAWPKSFLSQIHAVRVKRNLLAFGVGLPVTGKLSLANMLKREYRATHAAEVWTLTDVLNQASRTQNKLSLRDQARLL